MGERETWYVLDDGTNANPAECSFDKNGWPVHKDGRRVAEKTPGVPHSRGVNTEAERAKVDKPAKPYKNREMKTK